MIYAGYKAARRLLTHKVVFLEPGEKLTFQRAYNPMRIWQIRRQDVRKGDCDLWK